MDVLHEQAVLLRALVGSAPTPDTRAVVNEALSSRFEGLRSIALDVLGSWGDVPSHALISAFLRNALRRKTGWGIRTVAIRNLIPRLSAADAGWVLDLYFAQPDALRKHELVRLVIALPPDAAKSRLVAGLHDPLPVNRQAAVKALGNMPYPDRAALIRPLGADADPFVSKSARLLSAEV